MTDLNQVEIITNKFNEKCEIKEKITYLVQGAYVCLTQNPLEVKKLKYTQKHVLIGLSEFHIFLCRYKTDQKNAVCIDSSDPILLIDRSWRGIIC
jgi:hypothetical protein